MNFFKVKQIISISTHSILLPKLLDKNVLSVLCYHSFSFDQNRYAVNLETFKRQISVIKKHSRIISIDEGYSEINNSKIKKPAVVVTVDDGYKDVLMMVDFMTKNTLPITLFVISDRKNANRIELDNQLELLTNTDLKKLAKNPLVTIGSHSVTHSNFLSISKKQLEFEIFQSKRSLEELLGVNIKYFAYPKGLFNSSIVKIVKRAGYIGAFTIEAGCISKNTDKFLIPRTIIEKHHNVSEFPSVYCLPNFWLRKATNRFNLWGRLLN